MSPKNYVSLSNSEEDIRTVEYEPSTKDERSYVTEPEKRLNLFAAVRKWPKVSLWCMALTSTILLWGYDHALISSVSGMPVFQIDYGEAWEDKYIIPSNWLSIWSIGSPIGMMLGALIAGWLGDKIGRKKMMFLSAFLSAGSVLVAFLSCTPANIEARRGLLFLAKFTQGICIGALCSTTQTYMSETAPDPLRGPVMAMFPIFQLSGQMIGSIVIQARIDIPGSNSYRVGFATMWIFGVMPLFLSIFLPESPAWLLRKGNIEKARRSHSRLEGNKNDPFATASFISLQSAIARQRKESSSLKEYLNCFKETDLRRTMIVAFANICPELFGLALTANTPYFLQTIGVDHSRSNVFFMAGILLALVANLSSLWTLTKLGRRTLMFWSFVIVSVIWMVTGIVGTATTISKPAVMQWTVGVAVILATFAGSGGAWPASYVVGGETSSLRLRAKTQGVGWFVSGAISTMVSFVLPYVYNDDAGALGAKTLFVMLGFSMFGATMTWFFVPELKGRSAEDADRMFELGLKTRDFEKWSRSGETQVAEV